MSSRGHSIFGGFSLLVLSILSILSMLVQTPARAQELHRVVSERGAMGTQFRITICAPDTAGVGRALDASWRAVDRLNQTLSNYDPDSETSRLSRSDHSIPNPVSPTFWAAWMESEKWHTASAGVFDVTLGALTQLWRHAVRRQELPDSSALAQARLNSGRGRVRAGAGTLQFTRSGLRLDFGGIGKGIAADSMLAALARRGFGSALIDAGGDITAGDAPAGALEGASIAPGRTAGWRVAVPNGQVWSIKNASVASSGDSQQFIQVDSGRYSHILDPATGLGLVDQVSATVLAETGAAADALATILSIRPDLAGGVVRGARVAIFGSGPAAATVGSPEIAAALTPVGEINTICDS